ncbi:MAG: hypothetical protein FJ271_18585 [Planctomycetes bacterium]|nr:hypothetical protein [Planctomycetota bacterium]
MAAATVLLALLVAAGVSQEPAKAPLPPVRVSIQDEKPVVVEPVLPVAGVPIVQYQTQPNMMVNVRVNNQTLHLGFIQTMFHVDGQVIYPGNPPGRMVLQNAPLPRKGDKQKPGFMSIYEINNVRITQTIQPVPTKPRQGKQRLIDTVLVNYLVENNDNRPHKVGVRIFMDVFIVNNDGALFAAPNHPGQVLDGVELKGKKVPDYLQFLQQPNLKNPGFVAHMTLNFGRAYDMPDRAVLTRLGAFRDQWNLQAIQAMGDSAMGVYWEPKDVKAKSKRQIAYAYGAGVASSPEGDGHVNLVLGGSFEPGKLFSVAAYVQAPAQGQSLTLELPAGMERVEGRQIQPVPMGVAEEEGNAMVLWKCRVLRTGQHIVRVRSSTGVTQAKIVTITRPVSP